jgi:hypothetical protein
MKRTTIVNLLLSVLALVAVALALHQLVTQVRAADLTNDIGATCNGTGVWHFVNNQVGAVLPPGTLTANFSCGSVTVTAFKVNPNGNQQFNVVTSGSCSLLSASTNLPGKLVLSDFTCLAGTPTPTPTPSPSPTAAP